MHLNFKQKRGYKGDDTLCGHLVRHICVHVPNLFTLAADLITSCAELQQADQGLPKPQMLLSCLSFGRGSSTHSTRWVSVLMLFKLLNAAVSSVL